MLDKSNKQNTHAGLENKDSRSRKKSDVQDLIIYLPISKEPFELLPFLKEHGWDPHIIVNRFELDELLSSRFISTGIILISDEWNQEDLLETLKAYNSIQWVGIFDPLTAFEQQSSEIRDYLFDFHSRPVDFDKLLDSLGKASIQQIYSGKLHQHRTFITNGQTFGLIGSSPAMEKVFANMQKIIACDEPVILIGETGTGKSALAKAIHDYSRRAGQPFMVVNCGALSTEFPLGETYGELHSFANSKKASWLASLDISGSGTLFLDGLDELSPMWQVNLLQHLDENLSPSDGGSKSSNTGVRLLASAMPSLHESVRSGKVREDLYYRLKVLQLDIPPLRDRGNDVVAIAEKVIEQYNRNNRRNTKHLARSAIDHILEYPWPGNVQELIGCVRRAAVLSIGSLISRSDLGLPEKVKTSGKTLQEVKSKAVTQALMLALSETRSISSAARQLGISRVTLYRLMEKHSITSAGSSRQVSVDNA